MPGPTDPQSFAAPIPSTSAPGASWLYVTGEDALACTVFNAAAGVTVTITGRMLEFGQTRPTPFTQTLIPATDRSASVVRFNIGDGWLLNAQVLVSGGTPAIGQTFARLSLVRGLTTNAIDLNTLAAGYVTAKMPLSYPGSSVLASVEGAGSLRAITGATPAAGAEISETVPTGARWDLLAFTFTLTTSVAVANRSISLVVDDGTTQLLQVSDNSVQAAGLGQTYSGYHAGQIAAMGGSLHTLNLPPSPFMLAAGFRIRTATALIQAADQYSGVKYLVREWIEGA